MRKKKSKKIMRWGTRLRVLCMVCFNPQSTFKQTQTWITVASRGAGALTSQIRLFDNTMRKKILRFMTKEPSRRRRRRQEIHKHNTKLATTLYVPKVIQIPTLPYARIEEVSAQLTNDLYHQTQHNTLLTLSPRLLDSQSQFGFVWRDYTHSLPEVSPSRSTSMTLPQSETQHPTFPWKKTSEPHKSPTIDGNTQPPISNLDPPTTVLLATPPSRVLSILTLLSRLYLHLHASEPGLTTWTWGCRCWRRKRV
jgi:ribosomal protein S27E